MRTLCFALALLLAACADSSPNAPNAPAGRSSGNLSYSEDFVAWENCPSRTLEVTFNSPDSISKPDLQGVWRILSRYRKLHFVPHEGVSHEPMLRIRVSDGCSDLRCALNQGWEAIQSDLFLVPGASVSCDAAIEPVDKGRTSFCPSRSDQDPRQDLPKQEAKQDGGVGVGN